MTQQQQIKKYNITMSYIEPDKENLYRSHYIQSYNENYQVNDVKELKEIMKDLIESNIADNQQWFNDIAKEHFKEIDPIYTYYNNLNASPFYNAELSGLDKQGNITAIIRVEAYRITKKESLSFIEVVNK